MQQNIIIKHNHEQGQASHQNEGQLKIYGGNAIWNKCIEFFGEDSSSFRCFQSDGEFIPGPMCSNRESTFTQIDDLGCLEIFE